MTDLFISVLIASLWGGVFTVLFMLVNKLFKTKLPVSWHYYIWLVVLIRLLIPAFFTVSIESWQVPFANEGQTTVFTEAYTINTTPIYTAANTPVSTKDTLAQVNEPPGFVNTAKDSNNAINSIFRMSNLWVIWLFVAITIFSFKVLSYLLYIKRLKPNNIPPSSEEKQLFDCLLKEKMSRTVMLFKNKDAQTPFVIGLWRPMVILPETGYTPVQLGYIFSHELNHIAKYDIAIKWLFEIAKAMHWFNPFVYIASRNASFYCETLCDSNVLRNSDDNARREYGLTIIEIVNKAVSPKTSMCISMSSRKSNLKERIQSILSNGQSKRSVMLTIVITISLLSLCAFSSIKYKEGAPTSPIKTSTNFMVVGLDDYAYADVIIIVNFNTETNNISLLSVPRDTYLPLSEDMLSKLNHLGINDPLEQLSLLMAYEYGGNSFNENGIEYLEAEISKLLQIEIDYHIIMDMSAFEKLVDAVGGVDMEIPEGGLYYNDTAQDLEIALAGGMQHLDGNKALQFVRYHPRYVVGNYNRIDTQRQFIGELYRKIVRSDDVLKKASASFSILIENTETNLTISDFASYAQYIPEINPYSLQTFVLPVKPNRLGNYSYVFINDKDYESYVAGYFR